MSTNLPHDDRMAYNSIAMTGKDFSKRQEGKFERTVFRCAECFTRMSTCIFDAEGIPIVQEKNPLIPFLTVHKLKGDSPL